VTEWEAKKMANFLAEAGWGEERETFLRLQKEKGTHHVYCLVWEGAWDDPEAAKHFTVMAGELSELYNQSKVAISLCDDNWVVKRTLHSDDAAVLRE